MTRHAAIRAFALGTLISLALSAATGCGTDAPVAAGTTATTAPLPPMTQFRIGYPEGPQQNCSVHGTAVTCALSVVGPSSVEYYTGTVTGTLAGRTLMGTRTTHQRFRDEADNSCILEIDKSEAVEYVFSPDGTVTMHGAPADVRTTRSGSCAGTETGTDFRWEDTQPWSVTGGRPRR